MWERSKMANWDLPNWLSELTGCERGDDEYPHLQDGTGDLQETLSLRASKIQSLLSIQRTWEGDWRVVSQKLDRGWFQRLPNGEMVKSRLVRWRNCSLCVRNLARETSIGSKFEHRKMYCLETDPRKECKVKSCRLCAKPSGRHGLDRNCLARHIKKTISNCGEYAMR